MKSIVCALLVLACVGIGPCAAHAGWVVEWRNTSFKPDGQPLAPEAATMRIARGQVRLVQPNAISLIDYNRERFTILNIQRQAYWSGAVSDYVSETVKNREAAIRERAGSKAPVNLSLPTPDDKNLPPIVIKRTTETKTIAGHPTVKYTVESRGALFQELWLAEDLNLSADLDAAKFLAYERKMNGAMVGQFASAFAALYRSDDYRQLYEKGFILQSIVHHNLGGYERQVTDIRPAEIEASDFAIPESYRKVGLAELFPAPEAPPRAGRR